ncbi:hypothetical protein AMTRI_Chr04g183900 [Amborella trichopoda]|uniref:Uncharacterized protein n=1 Tax=Amborella trichopoda TaxID=13333 RepID=W1NNI2_AMBTC|nr:hypothetical protein AMTR_s00073p00145290 [Amborella trichopoda]
MGSDYKWASSPDGVLFVDREVSRIIDHLERKQEHAAWKKLNPTVLRPLAPHQLNGVNLNHSDSDDGSDYEWAPSPDGVRIKREVSRITDHFERKQEPATWKEMHPTALGPLAPHQVNGVEENGDNSPNRDLFFTSESSPSLSLTMTRSKGTTRST